LAPGTDLKQSFSAKHGGDLTFNTTPLHNNLTPTKLKSSLLLIKRNEDLKNVQSNDDGGNGSTPRVQIVETSDIEAFNGGTRSRVM
jgi:hypothetical protein